MKKEWYSYVIIVGEYPEDERVIDALNILSKADVRDSSIKIVFNESQSEVAIFYRHTHEIL